MPYHTVQYPLIGFPVVNSACYPIFMTTLRTAVKCSQIINNADSVTQRQYLHLFITQVAWHSLTAVTDRADMREWAWVKIKSCLPGLSSAGSTKSGRLVAPITNTSVDLLSPSISASNWDTTLSSRDHNTHTHTHFHPTVLYSRHFTPAYSSVHVSRTAI